MQSILFTDMYKLHHREQYPEGTQVVYSTWTPRSNHHLKYVDKIVVFGIQAVLQKLAKEFDDSFFSKSLESVLSSYKRILKHTLNIDNPETKHIEELWYHGKLPLRIKALSEGSIVSKRIPILTIENTRPEFFWLTNYLETWLSSELWKPTTTASIAYAYCNLFTQYAVKTSTDASHVSFQGHDFSLRGLSGMADGMMTGMGHLLSFKGTDNIPAIMMLEQHYGADVTKELVGCSVPASEHSVMCAGQKDDEQETFRRLIEDIYPSGIVSIVSDTWDLWKVLHTILPNLKESILERHVKRNGKVVIRPDSGNPVKIICGDSESNNEYARKGVLQMLWDIFGGTINEKGYKVLHPCVGAIYGDSITFDVAKDMLETLERNFFASSNIVLGIGSYTYQHITRDSLGFAMKATSVTINDNQLAIFKDPVTDNGIKKSAYGRVKVCNVDGVLTLFDENTTTELPDELKMVFENGEFYNKTTLSEIRYRLEGEACTA